MAPQIGQRARLNGKDVVWSGNHGWQSPASYNKLEQQGKFKLGAQVLDRLWSSAPQQIKDVSNEVQRRLANPIIGSKADALPERFRPTGPDATSRALKATSDKLNVDQRIVTTAANLAQAISGRLTAPSAIAANRVAGIKGATKLAQAGPGYGMNGMNALPAAGGGATKTPFAVGQRLKQDPQQSIRHAYSDARQIPNVADDWAVVARGQQIGNNPSFVKLTPEQKIRLRQGGDATLNGRALPLKEGYDDLVPPTPKPSRNREVTNADGDRIRVDITEYGQPTHKPATNKPTQNPQSGPGNPRPQRVQVEGQPGPKRLAKGYDVKPEEMPRFPISDGNKPRLPTDNRKADARTTAAQNAARKAAADKAAKASGKDLKAQVLEDIAWADGKLGELHTIAGRVGAKAHRTASETIRAIEQRLNGLHKEGRAGARKNAELQWDSQNLDPRTPKEVKRLNEAWNRPGLVKPPINQQPSGRWQGGSTSVDKPQGPSYGTSDRRPVSRGTRSVEAKAKPGLSREEKKFQRQWERLEEMTPEERIQFRQEQQALRTKDQQRMAGNRANQAGRAPVRTQGGRSQPLRTPEQQAAISARLAKKRGNTLQQKAEAIIKRLQGR